TMPPFCTDNDTPLSTRMTRSYTTSILLRERMALAAGSGAAFIGVAASMVRSLLAFPGRECRSSPRRPGPSACLLDSRFRGDERNLNSVPAYDDLSHGSVRFGQPALAFTYSSAVELISGSTLSLIGWITGTLVVHLVPSHSTSEMPPWPLWSAQLSFTGAA